MFTNFSKYKHRVNEVEINFRMGGNGPGLLLLHGHPQTHAIWHKVADQLAERYTVIAADLRGYGDSSKPQATKHSILYSKREMALDCVQLMKSVGFDSFDLIAHDRGARVAHRLAVDHPSVVRRLVLLDIAPTSAMYNQTTEKFARAYWHWFFLIRPSPLPETLIEADPELYLRSVMGSRSAGLAPFTDEAFSEYLRCLRIPGTARGICEDYRASAGIDIDHEKADRLEGKKINAPILVLWGENGAIQACFDPLKEWGELANNVSGRALPCGHYIPEEAPDLLLKEALSFLE